MKHLKAKLMSAIAITLVAAIMMTTASYAWFTISTNPEIKGAETEVVVNENLEIALAHTSATMPTAIPGASQPGDSLFTGTNENKDGSFTWGNLIELAAADKANEGVGYTAAEEYGRINTVLRPITLVKTVKIILVTGKGNDDILKASKLNGDEAYLLKKNATDTYYVKGSKEYELLDSLTADDQGKYQTVAYNNPSSKTISDETTYNHTASTKLYVTKTYDIKETFNADGTHKDWIVDKDNYKFEVEEAFVCAVKSEFWYPKYGKDGRISNKYSQASNLLKYNIQGQDKDDAKVSGMGMLVAKESSKIGGKEYLTVIKGGENDQYAAFTAGTGNYAAGGTYYTQKTAITNHPDSFFIVYKKDGKEYHDVSGVKTAYTEADCDTIVYYEKASYAYFIDFWVRSNESGWLKLQSTAVKRSSGDASHDVEEAGYLEGDKDNYLEGATAGTYFESKKCKLFMEKTELTAVEGGGYTYATKYVVSDEAKARLMLAANVRLAIEDITPNISGATAATATSTIKVAGIKDTIVPVVTGLPEGVEAQDGYVSLNTTDYTISLDLNKLVKTADGSPATLSDAQTANVQISFKTTFAMDDVALMVANEAKLLRAYFYVDGRNVTNAAASLLDNDNSETDNDGTDVAFTNDGKINVQFVMDEVKQSMDKVEDLVG